MTRALSRWWLCRGGILADDMGLGKTITALAVIVAATPHRQSTNRLQPTLVVAPKSLLFNWASEVRKHCRKLRSSICHGSHRLDTTSDVVLTTFDMVRTREQLRNRKWCLGRRNPPARPRTHPAT